MKRILVEITDEGTIDQKLVLKDVTRKDLMILIGQLNLVIRTLMESYEKIKPKKFTKGEDS